MPQTVFERVEKKYLLTPLQAAQLQSLLQGHLVPDEYGTSTVCSLFVNGGPGKGGQGEPGQKGKGGAGGNRQ